MTRPARARVDGTQWEITDDLVASVEASLGHRFDDTELRDIALCPPLAGFSRLEFLGDAVLGLALGAAGVLDGAEPGSVVRSVTNKSLDARLGQLGLDVADRSGDVIETLVGAVHLDAGFDAAATAAVRMCGPLAGLQTTAARHEDAALSLSASELSFVGAAILSAAAADSVVRLIPDGVARQFTDERKRLVARRRLMTRAVELPDLCPWPIRHPDMTVACDEEVADAADELEAAIAEDFFARGWDVVAPQVQHFIM